MRSLSTDIFYTFIADGNILRARLTPGLGKTLISLPFSTFSTHPALVSRSVLLEATEIRLSYLVDIAAGHIRGVGYLQPICLE